MNQESFSPSLIDDDVRFRRYYAQHLQPLEQRFESLRRDAVKERNRRIVGAVVAWLVAVAGIVYLARPIGEFWPFVAFFGVATLIGLGMWAWLPAGAHELRLQDQILSRIVPFFGDLRYQSEPDFSPEHYFDWKVLPSYSRPDSEDQIEGSYRGVTLKLAEVTLKYQSRSRGSDGSSGSTAIAFKGLMIDFGLAEEYPGVTLIRSQGSDMNHRFHLDEDLDEVDSGSGFEVYATSDAPGTRLADGRFLERLAEISSQFQAKQLFASFHQDRLVMLIDKKDNYFEMSHRQETNFAKDAERIRNQLGRLFAIVDLLQLPGKATEDEVDAEALDNLEFPELPDPKAVDPYDIGGWGCLNTFIIFAIAMSAYLLLLDSELSKGALLWWSALGGSLLALGLFQAVRGALRRSGGAVIFGIILLAGAFAVLYYYAPILS